MPLALAAEDRGYLLDPAIGMASAVDPSRLARLSEAFDRMAGDSEVDFAAAVAVELLEVDPELAPAHVLLAQVDFVRGADEPVVARLGPVAAAAPAYIACQLVLGRSQERLGDLVAAYTAFRAVATRSSVALKRTRDLHPRVLEAVFRRLTEAVAASRLADAEGDLGLLRSWAPTELATIEGERLLAVAQGDPHAERAAVEALAQARPDDRLLAQRWAELELEVGDPGRGLDIVQSLVTRYPGDPRVAELLERAKFHWRIAQLPASVRDLASKPELTRGDFAVLLYWLVPDVRSSRPTTGRIASDVLGHPGQEEIIRVVNLRLIDLDQVLHRYFPSSPMRWSTALRAAERLTVGFGRGEPCREQEDEPGPCAMAARCGLLAPGRDCDPSATLSGPDGFDLLRRCVGRLGGGS